MIDLELIKGLAVGVSTLAIYSLLYRENTFFRVAEHIYVGLGIGYSLYFGGQRLIQYVWTPITTKGEWIWIIPVILGIVVYARFFKKWYWLSLWPMAVIIGTGLGLAMGGLITTMVISLVVSTITLNFADVSNIVFLITTFTTISYFIFTREHVGTLGHVTKVGRFLLMAAFGASMASNVFAFCSRVGGTIQPLLVYPAYIIVILFFILVILDSVLRKKK